MEGGIEIIGTSHIARESVGRVTKRIEENKPDIVAVELDARRAHALLHDVKPRITPRMVFSMGVKGFLFYVLANFLQKRLGRVVGVQPGADMRAALLAAVRVKARVAFIDRDLGITMQRLSSRLGWRERFRFVYDLFAGFFSKEVKELRGVDISRVPSGRVIEIVLKRLKKDYPGLYAVLVGERNEHMASALARIRRMDPDASIVAVVGAGHEVEISKLLRKKLKENAYSFSIG